MSKYEKELANKVLKDMPPDERKFRCNAGQAWQGKVISVKNGITTLKNASIVKLLPNGTPDYCGWKTVKVTQEMVDNEVELAVFLGEEHKATKRDKLRKDQILVKKVIVKMGGIHREVREDGRVIETCNFN